MDDTDDKARVIHIETLSIKTQTYKMSEGPTEGDEDFRSQSKYKQFVSAVDRALKVFELSTEWHDLISALAKLNKVGMVGRYLVQIIQLHMVICLV